MPTYTKRVNQYGKLVNCCIYEVGVDENPSNNETVRNLYGKYPNVRHEVFGNKKVYIFESN